MGSIQFFKIKQNLKDMNRLREIAMAFAMGGFSYYLKKTKLNGCVSLRCRIKCAFKKICNCPKDKHSLAVHFREVIENLGPTFIKLGQLLSLRPDIIPQEYCDELRKLQDKVPGFSFKDVKKIIEEELHKPIDKIFDSFEEKPIAAASIAQVHRAKLKNGKKVAVKILRPNVEKVIEQDIRIIEMIAGLLEKHVAESRSFRPKGFAREFKEWTMKEIDFRNEAAIMNEMKNRQTNDLMVIPEVYFDLTSKRVLTMEFIDGIHIDNNLGLSKLKINKKQLAVNGIKILVEQTLVNGLFHGDPHPGNILALKGNKFGFLDFGIIGRLTERQRKKLSLYLFYLFKGDFDRALHHILDLAETTDDSDLEGFKRKAGDILSSCYGSIETNSLSNALFKSIIAGVPYKVYFPSDLVLLSKAFVTIESVGRNLYPSFSILTDAREPVESTLKKLISPANSLSNLIKNSIDYSELMEEMPIHVAKILKTIEGGKINVNIDSGEFVNYLKELHEAHIVRVVGMIVASLILASGITSFLQNGPKHMLSLPMIEIYVAILLSLWLIIFTKRKKGGEK